MKKCVLYDDKICDNCGECMRCDLDPNKLCDNCGKCLKKTDDDEFLSIVVHADETEEKDDDFGFDEPEDDGELTEEEKQLRAFLDAPIDLHLPDPIEVDPELQAKWEKILAEYEAEEKKKEEPDVQLPEIGLHGTRKRRKKDQS